MVLTLDAGLFGVNHAMVSHTRVSSSLGFIHLGPREVQRDAILVVARGLRAWQCWQQGALVRQLATVEVCGLQQGGPGGQGLHRQEAGQDVSQACSGLDN